MGDRGDTMIRVPVKTKKGVYRVMRTRVPRTRTFELYRRAEAEAPELLKQIYAVISRDVEARGTETVHRSAVLMDRVPSDWPYQKRWVKFSDSEAQRRSLLEQVLWTYFFDRQETWETTWPDKGQTGAEYVRPAMRPPVARAPAPRPKRAATPASEVRSRGIDVARSRTPAAGLTEELSPGDDVEIVNPDCAYAGKIGRVTQIGPDDFGVVSVTVKLPADDQYFDVPNFDVSDLKKVR